MQKESVLVLLGLLILGLSLFWGVDGGVTGDVSKEGFWDGSNSDSACDKEGNSICTYGKRKVFGIPIPSTGGYYIAKCQKSILGTLGLSRDKRCKKGCKFNKGISEAKCSEDVTEDEKEEYTPIEVAAITCNPCMSSKNMDKNCVNIGGVMCARENSKTQIAKAVKRKTGTDIDKSIDRIA